MAISTANATSTCCGVQEDSVQLVPYGIELVYTVIQRLFQLSHRVSGILVSQLEWK